LGKIKIGIFGEKGFETRNFLTELMSVCLSERQANAKRACPVDSGHSSLERAPSERAQNATGSWSLKRATLRLSEQHPVQKLLIFSLRALGDQSELPRMFLLT